MNRPHQIFARTGLILCLVSICVLSAAAAPTLSGPAAAAKAFDSLLTAGKLNEARRLCTGQVLRMFDFIAMAQAKMADVIDTSKSTDTTLEEKSNGTWAYLKISSHVVFKRPMLGQNEIQSVQAIHLFHDSKRWLVAEMEELGSAADPAHLHTGRPEDGQDNSEATGNGQVDGDGKDSARPLESSTQFFPVSRKAPATAGEADVLQFRLQLKQGGSLARFCALGSEQRLIRAENPSQWILENRKSKLGPKPKAGAAISRIALDSLKPYLTSNTYLVLADTLLIATATRIAGQETDPVKVTGNIYSWVIAHFNFELGAVLFGTSSEVLRKLTGDCSEAAILTAALLRARGIPARLALGFASVGRGVFIGHAWTEAFLQGQWVGVDAALRQFPAGVERIHLAELDGKVDMRVAATNLMMSVLSNLDIEILSAEKNGKTIPLATYENNAGEGKKFFESILKNMNAH